MSVEIRLAQVIRVYPKFRTCEIAYLDDGWRATNVPILNQFASSDTGGWSMHNMPRPPDEESAGGVHPDPAARTVMAVVAVVDGRPLILGFLPRAMTQMAFRQEDQNRDIWRHPSGTIVTVNRAGSIEVQHTGGAFVKVGHDDGRSPADRHEDLTPLAWNENWVLPENEPPTVTIAVGDREGGAFKLRVRPNGDTDIFSKGNLRAWYEGNAEVKVGGNAEIDVGGDAEVNVAGDLSARAQGSLAATAQGDASLVAMGDGTLASAGAALVGSLSELTLEAPQINIAAGTLDITAGDVGITAGNVGVTAGAFGVTAAAIGLTGFIGLTGAVGIAGLLGVTGVVEAPDYLTGPGLVGPQGFSIGGGASFGGVAAAIAEGGQELGDAAAALAQATADIAEGVAEAVETSGEARGTGPMDNQGGTRPGESSDGDAGDPIA
jgi:hypothetical protein